MIRRPRTLYRAHLALAALTRRTGRARLHTHYRRQRHAARERRIPIGPVSYHDRLRRAAFGDHVCQVWMVCIARPGP